MKKGKRLIALILSAGMILTNTAAAPVWADGAVIYENDADADIWFENDLSGDFDDEMLIIDEDLSGEDSFTDDTPEDEEAWTDDDTADEEAWTEDDTADEEAWTEDRTDDAAYEDADASYEADEETDEAAAEFEAADDALTTQDDTATPGTDEAFDAAASIAEETEEAEISEADPADGDYVLTGAGVQDLPSSVNSTIEKFATALSKFTQDTSSLDALQTALVRFGGVTSLYSGGIAILQMAGILKDPTSEALHTILSELKNIETTLADINAKLDTLEGEMVRAEARQEEQTRGSDAIALQQNWDTFDTSCVVKLKDYLKQYKDIMDGELDKWWIEASHEGVRVCYTVYNGQPSLTFSKAPYGDGFPAEADNGEEVVTKYSFAVSAEFMPDTASTGERDYDTYADIFINKMADQLLAQLEAGKLEAGDWIYQQYATFKALETDPLYSGILRFWAENCAWDILNTVTYHLACSAMEENNVWVGQVMSAYDTYCDKVGNALDSLIHAHYKTHGFEGEAKESIIKAIDSAVVTAGYYGAFALTLAAQAKQHKEDKEALKDKWIKTVQLLDGKREKGQALTGYDNYCYISRTIVDYEARNMHSSMTFTYRQGMSSSRWVYYSFKQSGWEVQGGNIPDLLGDVDSLVLYYQYGMWLNVTDENGVKINAGKSYAQYLHQYGVNIPENFSGELVTTYTGPQEFALSLGLPLTCKVIYGNWFTSGSVYHINQGNRSEVKDEKFQVHDRVVCNTIDTGSGANTPNKNYAVRAAFLDASGWYACDEGNVFYSGTNISESTKGVSYWDYYCHEDTVSFDSPLSMLSSTLVSKSDIAENGPVMAYQSAPGPQPQIEAEPPYSAADWNAYEPEIISEAAVSEAEISERMKEEVDAAVRRAQAEGLDVTFTNEEKNAFAARLKEQYEAVLAEMKANRSLFSLDIFGGNDAAKLSLAKAVLPQINGTGKGSPKVTAENINTTVRYGAAAAIHFEEKNGRINAVINPVADVTPVLVIWNPALEEFMEYEITDEVMDELSLTMNVRLPAASAGDGTSLEAVHYNDLDSMRVIERKTAEIEGLGADRFIGISTAKSGPFELMITPLAERLSDAEVKLTRKLFTYNGNVQKPGVKVYSGGNRLAAGKDYYLTWSEASSKNAGTYTVTVTGKGRYDGALTASYTIRKAKNPLAVTRKKAEKKLSFAKLSGAAQTVKCSEMMKVSGAEGAVTYMLVSLVPAKYKGYFSIDKSTGVITVKKGLPKGSYKLKVRTKAAGGGNYNALSKVVVFRVAVK